ncbi:hypothetical protein F5144DRAFT_377177 [Chaetomium tenue]|uniref:Uncharacterized protein n=1 Tax=Chaetomium tenue TaxID=1854479 RepID=A0ACB7P012_9PEZI|nr:hypothetical protein F5144DRAFT_377177 [Chaetomium globosum]
MNTQQLNALEEWRDRDTTQLSASSWHTRWLETLEHVRGVRCAPDASPSSAYLPLLAFYMDHGILVLNAQARRELETLNAAATSPQSRAVYSKAAKVATRTLDIVLTDPVLTDLGLGFHNNQFIMICHAVAEVVDAIRKNTILPPHEAAEATLQVKAIPEHLEKTAQQLPTTSVARLYTSLAQCLVLQLNKDASPPGERDQSAIIGLQDSSLAAWWLWEGLPDSARSNSMVPTSLEVEQLMLDMGWNIISSPEKS